MKHLPGIILAGVMAAAVTPASAQFAQEAKIVGPDGGIRFGFAVGVSVSLSRDGETAALSGPGANPARTAGAAFVFKRKGGQWAQQARLLPTNLIGGFLPPNIGPVSLSRTAHTAIVGVPGDNAGVGAAVIFKDTHGQWLQETKLVPAAGHDSGSSIALADDGLTALVGAPGTNGGVGAAFVFVRRGGVWTQQAELIGSGMIGSAVLEGGAIALSADGNTAVIGAIDDDLVPPNGGVGAVWVFTRSRGQWSQEAKLVGTGFVNPADQGASVALSGDGNTIIVGGPSDANGAGAAWVFTRSYGSWSQQGPKLVGSNAIGAAGQGDAVDLSDDGNIAVIGGSGDDGKIGAAWVFTRDNGVWTETGKLIGTRAVGNITPLQGYSVAVSGNGLTVLSGAPFDGDGAGAAWVFTQPGVSPGSPGPH